MFKSLTFMRLLKKTSDKDTKRIIKNHIDNFKIKKIQIYLLLLI